MSTSPEGAGAVSADALASGADGVGAGISHRCSFSSAIRATTPWHEDTCAMGKQQSATHKHVTSHSHTHTHRALQRVAPYQALCRHVYAQARSLHLSALLDLYTARAQRERGAERVLRNRHWGTHRGVRQNLSESAAKGSDEPLRAQVVVVGSAHACCRFSSGGHYTTSFRCAAIGCHLRV